MPRKFTLLILTLTGLLTGLQPSLLATEAENTFEEVGAHLQKPVHHRAHGSHGRIVSRNHYSRDGRDRGGPPERGNRDLPVLRSGKFPARKAQEEGSYPVKWLRNHEQCERLAQN